MSGLTLTILPDPLVICRLDSMAIPSALPSGRGFWSLTSIGDEISLVCREEDSPPPANKERGLRAIKVQGPLDFEMTGILSSLAGPLADAGISVFAISTYDTDYILVKEKNLKTACRILQEQGHTIE